MSTNQLEFTLGAKDDPIRLATIWTGSGMFLTLLRLIPSRGLGMVEGLCNGPAIPSVWTARPTRLLEMCWPCPDGRRIYDN